MKRQRMRKCVCMLNSVYTKLKDRVDQRALEVERCFLERTHRSHLSPQQVSANHADLVVEVRTTYLPLCTRSFYQMRLDKLRNAEIAKRNRERLQNPANFPSVPKNLP